MSRNRARGFTLIELLAVVALIGLLASIVLVSLSSARARARDSARVETLVQVGRGLALDYTNSPTAFTGSSCHNVPHADIQNCALASLSIPNFPFKDPSYADATHPGACGTGPTAVCQFSITRTDGNVNPDTQNWQVCTYLEIGSGIYPKGPVSISSATSTPFTGAGACP